MITQVNTLINTFMRIIYIYFFVTIQKSQIEPNWDFVYFWPVLFFRLTFNVLNGDRQKRV